MSQSYAASILETLASTVTNVALAQIILWMNAVPITHAVVWNVEILAVTAVARYLWRRVFNRG